MNREPANEMNKEDPTQGIPVWLQPVTVNLEDLEAQSSHILLKERKQIRKMKTKGDLFCEQKSMVTKQQQSTMPSTEDVNIGTITDTLLWYKFSPLTESVSNQNFTGDWEEFTKAYRNRRRSQKSFIQTSC